MPEKKSGSKLASSGFKSAKSKAKAKEKKKNRHEVKLNRGTTAKSSTTKSKYFGAKKLPSTTPEPMITNEINSTRTSKSPARSVSQITVKAARLTVSRTSSCPTSASTSSLSSKTNREKSRQNLKQIYPASRSLASISHKAAASTQQSQELIGSSGDAKVKKKKQNLLVAIRPSNVESERLRFMARMFDYDPRFVYLNPPDDDVLERFAKPSKKLLDQVRIPPAPPHLPTRVWGSRCDQIKIFKRSNLPLSSFFPQMLINVAYFSSHVSYFLTHFGPLGCPPGKALARPMPLVFNLLN